MPRPRIAPGTAIGIAICADVAGAAVFAFGLSRAIAATAQGASPHWALLALVASPLLRASVGWPQSSPALALGQHLASEWRARVLPALLGRHALRPIAPGEAAALGTDHIAAIATCGERFEPARIGGSLWRSSRTGWRIWRLSAMSAPRPAGE